MVARLGESGQDFLLPLDDRMTPHRPISDDQPVISSGLYHGVAGNLVASSQAPGPFFGADVLDRGSVRQALDFAD